MSDLITVNDLTYFGSKIAENCNEKYSHKDDTIKAISYGKAIPSSEPSLGTVDCLICTFNDNNVANIRIPGGNAVNNLKIVDALPESLSQEEAGLLYALKEDTETYQKGLYLYDASISKYYPIAGGTSSIIPRFDATGSTSYKKDDIVLYGTSPLLYAANKPTSAPWNESDWNALGINEVPPAAEIGEAILQGDIIPDVGGAYSIGSEDKKLKAIYANEVYMSSNTLYIDGTPVFKTNSSNDITMTADEDQSIQVKTSGTAATNILSEQTVSIKTSKESSNIGICAGDMTSGNASNVNMSASNNIGIVAKNQITEKAPYIVQEATNGVSMKGGLTVDDLTVTNHAYVKGDIFQVDAKNLEVRDNMVIINRGETGHGVSMGEAGIRIDRGESPDYLIAFDETDDMFKVGEIGKLQTIASQDYVNEHTHTHSNDAVLNKLSEVNNNLAYDGQEVRAGLTASDGTAFRFGVTDDGQYGYIITKDGADTVIPFKTDEGGGGGTGVIPYHVTIEAIDTYYGQPFTLTQDGQDTISGVIPDTGTLEVQPPWSGKWNFTCKDYKTSVDLMYFGNYKIALLNRVYAYQKPAYYSATAPHSNATLIDYAFDLNTTSRYGYRMSQTAAAPYEIVFGYNELVYLDHIDFKFTYTASQPPASNVMLTLQGKNNGDWENISNSVRMGSYNKTGVVYSLYSLYNKVPYKQYRFSFSGNTTGGSGGYFFEFMGITPYIAH